MTIEEAAEKLTRAEGCTLEHCMECTQRAVRMLPILTAFAEGVRAEALWLAAMTIRKSYPCQCHEGYTSRDMVDSSCFRCVPLEEAAEEVLALLSPAKGER